MQDVDFKRIGAKIREIRLAKGLTQEYVASIAKVNTSHISNIENNRVKISLPTLIYVSNALGVTVDYILSDEYCDSNDAMNNEIIKELDTCNSDTKNKILKIIRVLK